MCAAAHVGLLARGWAEACYVKMIAWVVQQLLLPEHARQSQVLEPTWQVQGAGLDPCCLLHVLPHAVLLCQPQLQQQSHVCHTVLAA